MAKLLKKIKKKHLHHPEAKGLCFLALSLFLFLSLISYTDGKQDQNFLGILGHFVAYIMLYLFGLGSYLIVAFFKFSGYRALQKRARRPHNPYKITKQLYFTILLSSVCILLNVAAENNKLSDVLKSHVYTQKATISDPVNIKYTRYNAGGVPFYFLYRDISNFSLQDLLGDEGVAFSFATMALICLILITDSSFLLILQNIARGFVRGCRLTYSLFASVATLYQKKRAGRKNKKGPKKPTRPIFSPETQTHIKKNTPFTPAPLKFITLEEKSTPKTNVVKEKKRATPYEATSENLLSNSKEIDQPSFKKKLREQAQILEDTFHSFGIEAKVGNIHCGPTITSFEVHPAIGVKVQKITALENDIALNLQAKSIRIIAPIPGKAAVGIEVPSLYPQEVGFKEMLSNYRKSKQNYIIPVLLGKTVHGQEVASDLTKMPHCIIAGATGSGKSVCISTIIMSIVMNKSPEEVKLILVDPKKVELTLFAGLPHLASPVITEASEAYSALHWVVKEMQNRYDILKKMGLRNIESFNNRKKKSVDFDEEEHKIPEKMQYIVMIIDEFADLIMTSNADLETPITRIAQMARAIGIHLILATQRPSREVITGLIKANFPTRISFKVSSRINSQIILDDTGAETLLGNGDMLFLGPGSSQLVRCQGVFIRDNDINTIIDDISRKFSTNYLVKSFSHLYELDSCKTQDNEKKDAYYDKAVQIVVMHQNASTTFLQRKLKIGYARAASLIDALEESNVISPLEGGKRKVLRMNDDID